METCEVCGRSALQGEHPCRFAVCCSCWFGEACSDEDFQKGLY